MSPGDRAAEHAWVATLIAVQEGRSPVPLLGDDEIATLLVSGPRIAMIGASSSPIRPSNGVFTALLRAGYDVVPVNPREPEVEGYRCYATLADAVRETGRVDIVDVFRRPADCPQHAREAVEVGARCLWLQLGIASEEAGRIAHEAGLLVVMDRCTIIEHHRLVAGR